MDINKIKIEAERTIEKAENPEQLEQVSRKYLGRNGEVSRIFDSLKDVPKKKKAKIGKEANELKRFIEEKIRRQKSSVSFASAKSGAAGGKESWVDITLPGEKPQLGHLHPLTLVRRKIEEIFQLMGFSVVEGPEVENEWYNFDALNVPQDHPARDMQDTLFVKQKNRAELADKQKFLMRTQTSAMQVRYMEKNKPPIRIIVPGKVFRREATDASHEVQFYQIEGLMVDKNINVANFKAIIQEFFSRFFNKEVEIRLRPSFFPFVEPGFEVDMSCLNCQGKGCSACKKTGWVEIMGAGMVHPSVLRAGGVSLKAGWQGFAFGIGMDRLAMMKYKINDIRLFYSGDLRFLEQF